MRRLKIALTLLFAMSCSLFLFACGGSSAIKTVRLSGQKTEFAEGDAFATGDLKVEVLYDGEEEYQTLEADKYDVDNGGFDSSIGGKTFTVTVTPKEQEDTPKTATYTVTVNHNYVDGKCKCGAVQQTYDNLNDKAVMGAWGSVVDFTPGEGAAHYENAAGPVSGEAHASLGTLVAGQSARFTFKIDAVDTGNVWNTPLMGLRNGSVGTLPRGDSWIIKAGPLNAFIVPDGGTGDAGPLGGEAAPTDTPWVIYRDGDQILAADLAPSAEGAGDGAVVEFFYNYRTDGVFEITETMTKGSETKAHTDTFVVPNNAYEIVWYAEKVSMTLTKVVFEATSQITGLTATAPTNLQQPEGKMFDKTGITTTATFSGGEPVKDSYNIYAYVDEPIEGGEGTQAVRKNLSTTPLQAGMYNFHVDFNGMQYYFLTGGEANQPGTPETSAVKVIENWIGGEASANGASATTIVKNNVKFYSNEAAYDYAVTAEKTNIRLVVTGQASVLTEAQKTELGTQATHFIAFKLIGSKPFTEVTDAPEGAICDVVDGVDATLKNVNVVLPLTESTQNVTLTFKNGEATWTLLIDLAGLKKTPETSVEVSRGTFTLDQGGTYTVTYKGIDESDPTVVGGNSAKLSAILAAVQDKEKNPDGYRCTRTLYITDAKRDGTTITLTYNVSAPAIADLTYATSSIPVSLRKSDGEVIVSGAIEYDLVMSEDAISIGNNAYVVVEGKLLYVIGLFTDPGEVKDGALKLVASLNIQNAVGMSYNLGLDIKGGAAVLADENAITSSTETVTKLISLGNINDNTDYDRGAIMYIAVPVPARAEDEEATFYFTANEDTVNGQAQYTIYKVEANTITSNTVTPSGARTQTQEGSCVSDGIEAYTDSATGFVYGAKIVPATGAHVWKKTTDTLDTCTECGYTRELLGGEAYAIVGGSGIPVAPSATATEWWSSEIGVYTFDEGNFGIEYHYTHADGTGAFSNGRLQIFDGAATQATITLDLYSTVDVVVPDTMTVVRSLTKDGVVVPEDEWLVSHNNSTTEFNGDTTALIVRYGTTILVRTTWTAPSNAKYVNTVEIKNAGFAGKLQINGYTAALQNVTRRNVEIQTYLGQIELDGAKYDLAKGTPVAFENMDKTGEWPEGPASGITSVPEGDFLIVYEWDNLRDMNWWDGWVELNDGTNWYTAPVFEPRAETNNDVNGWGELYNATAEDGPKTTAKITLDGKEVAPVAGGGTDNMFGGHTVAILCRIGTTLTVEVSVTHNFKTEAAEGDGKVYTVTRTTVNFPTTALNLQVNGNTWWLDNFTVARSYVTPATK